jgi:hypothetical protein
MSSLPTSGLDELYYFFKIPVSNIVVLKTLVQCLLIDLKVDYLKKKCHNQEHLY